MKINIFGSTGIIGDKSLKILKKNFSNIKINLLFANKNYKKIILQAKTYKPKYICIKNNDYIKLIKPKIDKKINIITFDKLNDHLKLIKTDLTILSISGYHALSYFEAILKNTNYLGLVNKEVIVSVGHLFKKDNFLKNTKIFPIDSEHFSLFLFFNNFKNNLKQINKVYLTASGGPFLNYNTKQLDKVTIKQATNHPKWKMGIKNSIDSATLANKCLELIEAHYLFNIPYDKLDIIIHPESLVHSIIEFNNGVSILNYFYNDMDIPILNFLLYCNNKKYLKIKSKYRLSNNFKLNFYPPQQKLFPIYKTYKKIKNKGIISKILFNVINEIGVELFTEGKIKFSDIAKYVNKYTSLDINMPVSNVKNVIRLQNKIKKILTLKL